MNLALWSVSRIMSCISLLHSLQFSRLLRLEETIHLPGCVLQVRVIQDVVSRFHAGGLVPGDLHPHTLVDPGEAHVAYCRSAEVVKEKGRDASGFAGFTPSTQLRAHGSGVVEEYPLATLRASFALPPEPVLHLSVERQFARFFAFGLGRLQPNSLRIKIHLGPFDLAGFSLACSDMIRDSE